MKFLKQYIIINSAFIGFCAFSQDISGTALYEIKLAEDVLSYPAKLNFSEHKSIFMYKNHEENRWERDEGIGSFQVIYTDSIGELVIRDETKEHLRIRSFCQRQPYTFTDNVAFEWHLTEETRLIGELLCKKATTSFRGRKYQAWYCPEIKSKSGPWKFFGLPGLIIEVSDQSNDVNIKFLSLKVDDSVESIVSNSISNETTLFEFVKCLDEEWVKAIEKNKADIARLQAKFPDIEISDNGGSERKRKEVATELEYE